MARRQVPALGSTDHSLLSGAGFSEGLELLDDIGLAESDMRSHGLCGFLW